MASRPPEGGSCRKSGAVPAAKAPTRGRMLDHIGFEVKNLEAFCRDLISAYKIPRKYEFIDELPRNEMQKVDKKSLRRPYWDGDRTIGG